MRVVIKIGTSTLTHPTGHLSIQRVEHLCKVLADIKNAGHEVLLVSSGAIAMGVGKLHLPRRPDDIPSRQAAAAVGQTELMYIYDRLFGQYNHTVGQILLSSEDILHPTRRSNLHNTLSRLFEFGVIPILNENDSVATAELEGGVIGDNDTLSAEVALMAKASLLVLLTDIPGLFTADPRKDKEAKLIPLVTEINDDILALAGGAGSSLATGGMRTKLQAAQILQPKGIDMVITDGQHPAALYDIIQGKPVGTRFSFCKEA